MKKLVIALTMPLLLSCGKKTVTTAQSCETIVVADVIQCIPDRTCRFGQQCWVFTSERRHVIGCDLSRPGDIVEVRCTP